MKRRTFCARGLAVGLGLPLIGCFDKGVTLWTPDIARAADTLAKTLRDLERDLALKADQIVANTNYSAEMRIRQIQLATQGAIRQLDNIIANKQANLWNEFKNATASLFKEANDLVGKLLHAEDILVLDAQNLLNQLPFKEDVLIVRRIDGFSQWYKATGNYLLTIVGNAFKVNSKFLVKVNGAALSGNLSMNSQSSVLELTIPSHILESFFADDKSVRIPLVITSADASASKFPLLDTKILLLPKLPVSYKISAQSSVPEYSGPKAWLPEQAVKMPPTGDYDATVVAAQEDVDFSPHALRESRTISRISEGP